MRSLIVLLMVVLLVVVLAVPALAYPQDWNGNGKAYGAGIKAHCPGSYGQLVKASPHDFPPTGAKNFVVSGAIESHCFD